MNKILKGLLATCLTVPCAFSVSGCGKDEDPEMETWDGNIENVSEAVEGVQLILYNV